MAPPTGTAYPLGPGLSSMNGAHTAYAGVSLSTDAASASMSVSTTYSVVVTCADLWNLTGKDCPIPPRIDSMSPASSPTAGDAQITVTGDHLEEVTEVIVEYDSSTGVRTCPSWGSISILSRTRTTLTFETSYCPHTGAARVILISPRGGSSEARTDPADRILTYYQPPPDPPEEE